MDEVLISNFMIFQDAVEEGGYDLVIADEAWDIDHYWHEHPELKKANSPGSPTSSATCRCPQMASTRPSSRPTTMAR